MIGESPVPWSDQDIAAHPLPRPRVKVRGARCWEGGSEAAPPSHIDFRFIIYVWWMSPIQYSVLFAPFQATLCCMFCTASVKVGISRLNSCRLIVIDTLYFIYDSIQLLKATLKQPRATFSYAYLLRTNEKNMNHIIKHHRSTTPNTIKLDPSSAIRNAGASAPNAPTPSDSSPSNPAATSSSSENRDQPRT